MNTNVFLKVTLIKSLIAILPSHKRVAACLKLNKIGKTVIIPNNPMMVGMINKISYLLKVEECEGGKA